MGRTSGFSFPVTPLSPPNATTFDGIDLSSALMQCTGDPIFLLDEFGKIVHANPAFHELLGYRPAELSGLDLFAVVDDEPARVRANLLHVLQTGFTFMSHRVYLRRDQTRVDVEVTATALRSVHSDYVGVIARDITGRLISEREQARLRDAVTNAAAEWRHTFDAISNPIFVLDAGMRVHRLNRAGADFVQRSIPDSLQHSVPDSPLWNQIASLVSQALTADSALCASLSDQGREWQINITPRDNRTAVVVLNDVTDLHRLQESLRKNQVMTAMGALVGSVAHEVRNPIFTISALLETFELSFRFTPEQRPYIQHLRCELEKLNQLMNDLLVYGKAGATEKTECDLVPLVHMAIEMNERLLRSREIEVRFAPTVSAVILADSKPLVTAIRNLVDNAVHHSPAGAVVEVSMELTPTNVRLSVRDHGNGFTPEALQHALEPFFSRRANGTGLGLAIAQRVAVEHGGDLHLSNHKQGGACVSISLPLAFAR